jgi:pimeloyl-ACP methyl ester carboxylesterase/CRP-like cAMP-binding protein
MPEFVVDGLHINAADEGPREGQLCVMLHGWSSSRYALSPLLPLVSRRYRTLAVDLPGYGSSERPHRRISIDGYAETIAHLIQQLSDKPAVLIGHSMGGMISISLALRYPQLVERMVLLCPTISGNLSFWINTFVSPITALERFSLTGNLLAALEPYMLSVTDRLMRPASFAERSAISETDYHRLREDARRPGQGRVRAECYLAMRDHDLSGRLASVEPPSLVIWGAEDNTVPLRDAGVVADEWPTVDLRIVPRAGHWPQFETPDITRRYIASYLGLPLITTNLEDSTSPAEVVGRAAEFLINSDVGRGLTLAQRTRLASQCRIKDFRTGDVIAEANSASNFMLIVQDGTIDVLSAPIEGDPRSQRLLTTVQSGQITGEMALLDGGVRSAELRAGKTGVTVLILSRDRLQALAEDDPELGNAVIWNIAASLALRLRMANWQQQMLARELMALRNGKPRTTARLPGISDPVGG